MSHIIRDLTIINEARDKRFKIKELPADKTAIHLLSSIANKLNVSSNATGTLTHKITGKTLGPNETLQEAGIEDGDILVAEFQESASEFGQALYRAEFKENSEPRCPCLLLLDVSGSMEGNSIRELNAGIATLKNELLKDNVASLRVELGIITFGSEVKMVQEFNTVDNFAPPALKVFGMTSMGTAINMALDKLEQRKAVYKANSITYYRPWIFMITDGEPTDEWQAAAKRLKEAERDKKVAFFAVGVEAANMKRLAEISVRAPLKLKGHKFNEMFVWLSSSLTSTSNSRIEDDIPLQSPMGWGRVEA